MGPLLEDLRYGLRLHAKTIGFTLIAVITLGLGIGASTAVFGIVNAVMLKPLPYANFERIVIPWRLAPPQLNLGYSEIPWGSTEFQRISHGTRVFESLGAFKSDSFNLTGSGEPALVEGLRATAGFFPTLGVAPILGRTFTAGEDEPGKEHEVVLSFSLWKDLFRGDRDVVGHTVDLNSSPYTVIGVMPSGFVFPRGEEMPGSFGFPRQAQLWVPLALPKSPPPNAPDELAVIGRLRPRAGILQAQTEMNFLAARLEKEFPAGKGWFKSRVTPLTTQVAGDTRTPLLLMLGAVGVVLLIACSNVANLLLVRSLGRRTEFALRAALGAGRGRLIRQLLTESVLLAVAGGVVGILLAEYGVFFVKTFGPANLPRIQDASLDLQVFAFALGVTLASGIFFGMTPAMSATREDLTNSLRVGSRAASSTLAAAKIRNAFLVLEVALALVLVIASGLLVQTFFRLLSVDPGFKAAHVLTFELSLPNSKYPDSEHIAAFYQKTLQRLRSIPGVERAGITQAVPLSGATDGSAIRIPDRPAVNGKEPFANYTIASAGYFSAVGTPVLLGRDFLETDTAHSLPVVLINRAMAKKFWPGENPIGKPVGLASLDFPAMTIAGMVADVKHVSLREEAGPEMYVPFTQKPYPSMLIMQFVVRSKVEPAALRESLSKAVHSLDPGVPIAKVTTLAAVVDSSLAGQRFSTLLLGVFGVISLLLASIGMYGVISYSVSQRTREIGVRVALGATRRHVFGMIVGQGARLASIGIAVGLFASLGVTRLMASVLFGVHPTDAPMFAFVTVVLMAVALLACYLPARRAARLDPMIALRCD